MPAYCGMEAGVTPVQHAYLQGGDLVLTQQRRREVGDKVIHTTPWIVLHMEGEKLHGIRYEPAPDGMSVKRASFTGVKLPKDPPRPNLGKLKYGDPISLLDDNSLSGWQIMRSDRANGWSIEDGVLRNNPVQKDDGTSCAVWQSENGSDFRRL